LHLCVFARGRKGEWAILKLRITERGVLRSDWAIGRRSERARGRKGEGVKGKMGDSEITNYGAGSLEKRLGDWAIGRVGEWVIGTLRLGPDLFGSFFFTARDAKIL